MKSLLVLALLSIVLVFGISQAEAYEGKVNVSIASDHVYYYEGDMIMVEGMLINSEPILNEIVKINVIHPNGTIVNSGETTVNSTMELFEGVDEIWKFEYTFEIDEKYEPRIKYGVKAIYDDKSDTSGFSFSSLPEQQAIESGQALKEGKLVINPDEPQPPMEKSTQEIPSWVKEVAIAWGNDQITDEEFRNAIQYLISVGILRV